MGRKRLGGEISFLILELSNLSTSGTVRSCWSWVDWKFSHTFKRNVKMSLLLLNHKAWSLWFGTQKQSVAASQVKYKLCNTLAWNFLMNPPWNADALLLTWCQFVRRIRLSEGIFLSSKTKPCCRVVSTNDENLIINYERSGQCVCVCVCERLCDIMSVFPPSCRAMTLFCGRYKLWLYYTFVNKPFCKIMIRCFFFLKNKKEKIADSG